MLRYSLNSYACDMFCSRDSQFLRPCSFLSRMSAQKRAEGDRAHKLYPDVTVPQTSRPRGRGPVFYTRSQKWGCTKADPLPAICFKYAGAISKVVPIPFLDGGIKYAIFWARDGPRDLETTGKMTEDCVINGLAMTLNQTSGALGSAYCQDIATCILAEVPKAFSHVKSFATLVSPVDETSAYYSDGNIFRSFMSADVIRGKMLAKFGTDWEYYHARYPPPENHQGIGQSIKFGYRDLVSTLWLPDMMVLFLIDSSGASSSPAGGK